MPHFSNQAPGFQAPDSLSRRVGGGDRSLSMSNVLSAFLRLHPSTMTRLFGRNVLKLRTMQHVEVSVTPLAVRDFLHALELVLQWQYSSTVEQVRTMPMAAADAVLGQQRLLMGELASLVVSTEGCVFAGQESVRPLAQQLVEYSAAASQVNLHQEPRSGNAPSRASVEGGDLVLYRCSRCLEYFDPKSDVGRVCRYHPGVFHGLSMRATHIGWTCCDASERESIGCCTSSHRADPSTAVQHSRVEHPSGPLLGAALAKSDAPSLVVEPSAPPSEDDVHAFPCIPLLVQQRSGSHVIVHTLSEFDTLEGLALKYAVKVWSPLVPCVALLSGQLCLQS